jgi:hypothetical protein
MQGRAVRLSVKEHFQMRVNYRWLVKVAFLCALVNALESRVQAQTYVFDSASYAAPGLDSSLGNTPLVTADLNGDGIRDVVMLGSISSGTTVSIFLGKPDGSFAPRVDYPVQASGFTVGDFNGDGKLDVIVVPNGFTTTGNVLLGNGDGTLQLPVPLNQNIGTAYPRASSGDFNSDGKLDLLLLTTSSGGGGTMAILLNNGDATFQAPVTYTLPNAPYLALGDFNGDNKLDIAVSGGLSGSGGVSILINNGDGTFKNSVSYSIAGNIQALAAADLNDDGKLDLVVPSGGFSADVSVLIGNGDGSFGNPIVYTSNLLSLYSTSIALADFNGDGKLDVALTNSQGLANAVAILSGNGDGTFQNPPVLYGAGLLPVGVAILDANGDGKPDLAVAGGYGVLSYFSLTRIINRGNGTFANPANFPVLPFPYSVVTGDFNGDGNVDIASTSFTSTGGVSVLLGKGDGTSQTHVDSLTGSRPTAIVAGDFNGDNRLDLVVGDATITESLLSTLIGNGDGTFQNNISQAVPGIVRSLAPGDFNGDGKRDIAAVLDGINAVSIFIGHGDGSFALPVQAPTGPMSLSPPYHKVLAGDFNGDNKLDLAVATDNGVAVLLGNGNGTFQPFTLVPSLFTAGPGDELLAVADVNGDGKQDIVKATQTGIINVATGKGDGTFQQAQGFQVPSILNTQATAMGDFNGDEKLDVAFASQSSAVVTVLFGNGDGTFKTHAEYPVPPASNTADFIVAADFNGDGALDFALASFGNAEVSVLVNRPVAAFAPGALSFTDQAVGTTSVEQSVTLTNTSAAPLSITKIAASGDFAETNDCGSTLSSTKTCAVRVTFGPTAQGVRNGMLSFTDNGAVSPQALALSGTGTAAPGFLIGVASDSSSSQTITAGQTATYSLEFTPQNGFSGTVMLTCSGVPKGATCAATPGSFSLSGTSTTTATITVATTAAGLVPPDSIPAPSYFRLHFKLPWPDALLSTCILLALFGILGRRRTRPAWLAVTVIVFALMCTGCGGASPGQPPPTGTPANNYTLTVTATSGTVVQTMTLNLTVK